MDLNLFLALFGGIIFLGFVGQYFFNVTKVPVPVILLIVGILWGLFYTPHEKGPLFSVAPYFGTLALLLILFEGGLELEIEDTARQLGTAMLLGGAYFLFCGAGVYLIGRTVLDLDASLCLLLSLILAGTSPGILLPTISQLSISKEMKAFLALETTFTELLTVIGCLLFIEYHMTHNTFPAVHDVTIHFLIALGVALVLALLAGILWSRFMGLFSQEPLAYMLTLGFLCLLYSLTEWMGGKGTLAVFFFGLILGNAPWLATRSLKFLKQWLEVPFKRKDFLVNEIIKKINLELSFLVRSFFFVFLGLLFDFTAFDLNTGLAIVGIVCCFYLGRWAVCKFFYHRQPALQEVPLSSHLAMIPRGLANAVMAFLVMQLALPGSDKVPMVVFGVILGTNLIMALLIYKSEKQIAKAEEAPPAPAKEAEAKT